MNDRTILAPACSPGSDEWHDQLLAQLTGEKLEGAPLAPLVNDNGVIRNQQGRPVTAEEALSHLEFDVVHPKVVKTLNRVMTALTPNSGCDVILLVAPPGAGKTHVAKAVRRKVTSAAIKSGAWSDDMVPAILIEIGDEGKSDFDFKSVYSEICEAGHAPPVPHRNPPRLPHAQVDSSRGAPFRLRKAAQKAIKDRQTKIVMLDEAAHILNAKSEQTLLRHAKAVKTLANGSTAVLALICSYDGLPLLKIDTQLRRRIKLIHFERYRDDVDDDCKAFRSAVLSVAGALGLDLAEIDARIPLLMERTVGCVGAACDVFRLAIADGLVDGRFDYLEFDRNIPSVAYAEDVRRAARAAEQSLAEL